MAFTLMNVALLSAGIARADTDVLSFDDPGMHFRPPDGWIRVIINRSPDADPHGPEIVAAYVNNANKMDPRQIVITVEPWDGDLNAFEASHESDLRNQGKEQSTFVDKKELTKLSNGMPAFFMRVNQGNSAGQFLRSFQYIVIDKQRGIVASYQGRAGQFDEKDAKTALASLYVVVYPKEWKPAR